MESIDNAYVSYDHDKKGYNMQKTLLIKLSIIGGICLLFAIGLSLIQTLVYERQHYADNVVSEIASQHVNAQEVITPFIAVPTTITPACKTIDQKNCKKSFEIMAPKFASSTDAQQSLAVSTDTYKRGIYHATSYQGQLNFKQQYNLATDSTTAAAPAHGTGQSTSNTDTASSPPLDSHHDNDSINTSKNGIADVIESNQPAEVYTYYERGESVSQDLTSARLIIPVSDLRGVAQLPTVTINGKVMIANYPATPEMSGLSYVEVPLPATLATQSVLNIDVELPLMGLSAVRTIPLGQQFSMTMSSDWHAPNFIGQALPANKSFDNQGFQATWENQYLTVANNQLVTQCLINPSASCHIDAQLYPTQSYTSMDNAAIEVADASMATDPKNVHLNGFGVSFAEPNDVYLQTERTMKYALLLIMVSFGTFFLFEVIKSLRIHPIQYLLVGSALLLFYVLLLPLAEQVVFWQAYAIAATACVGLIGWYTFYVLSSIKRAAIFTVILGGLYAGFYGILTTEDMNLLLGAIFCFVLLASVMYLTRKIDWYQVA